MGSKAQLRVACLAVSCQVPACTTVFIQTAVQTRAVQSMAADSMVGSESLQVGRGLGSRLTHDAEGVSEANKRAARKEQN
ncbi:hypothetical protein BJD12_07590 [Xanthomonas vesicatoria ATCC 35937]|uniref:Uncharacterized protein n=1 Tax=Xanthomonas vesicatoria ATCC 35937 TaxID=925775 RepID=F0BHX0_9XANT|nr:hypothetical protein BJD12_07590 [Xanthomonas vesicatoria ATCC 35937]EGD07926.1 hypothetical protein XVE_3869 [Xanthomonas vesicatoria ATCC 35937]KTF31691.1 hypothetical protein LMG920_15375 [Xanthomonas vesicatoria]KTF38396.1 hypothetical protein LMG919_03075 [Xanthomonas vesicatoria]